MEALVENTALHTEAHHFHISTLIQEILYIPYKHNHDIVFGYIFLCTENKYTSGIVLHQPIYRGVQSGWPEVSSSILRKATNARALYYHACNPLA